MKQLEMLQLRLEQTKLKLDVKNASGLSGELLTGDALTAILWGYFAGLEAHSVAGLKLSEALERPGLSYGLYHTVVQPNKLYGIVTTSIKLPGMMMDVGHLRHIRVAKNYEMQTWRNYNRVRGQFSSAMEDFVPNQFLVDRNSCNVRGALVPDPGKPSCPEGVTAVKALAIAQSEGQKTYVITSANQQVIAQLALSAETKAEISNAVAAGKEVTAHERPINVNGWTGAGYIVLDAETGAGAYLIEGKANGKYQQDNKAKFLAFAALAGNGDKDGGKAILDLLIDIFSGILAAAFGVLTGALKEALGYLKNLVELYDKCSGVQLVFMIYAITVISFAIIILPILLGLPILIGVLLGGVLNALLGAIFSDVFVPMICKKN